MPKKIIMGIENGGIGEELQIDTGDFLLTVNGKEILDVFDYRYETANELVTLEIEKKTGEILTFEIEKDEDEDLGLVFETWLMDKSKSCANKCLFCFIDQLPPGMRETLYFKDDDCRLSFLTGNYVTLTNISDKELDRFIKYRLSPVNISIHAVSPAIREKMLRNPRAGKITEHLAKFKEAGIFMNFQIVLCKGINDGDTLDETITALAKFAPEAKSLSVVPVGLTKYRNQNGLYPLEPFGKADAAEVLKKIRAYQKIFRETLGTRFVYAADEFYLTAGQKIPGYSSYEGFPQIENGVGMAAAFRDEFSKAVKKVKSGAKKPVSGRLAVVTGTAAYGLIKELADIAEVSNVDIIPVKNIFFGENVTVSGLLTGRDIIGALNGQGYDTVLIPENALRSGEEVFLDNVTVSEVESELGALVIAVPADGAAFADLLMGNI